MNEGRIVVVNLAKGRIGETPSHLLGAFFASSLAQAAYRRDRLPPEQRTSFTVYADELQSYATDSFAAILSEARKYNLHLVLAHQFMAQLPGGLGAAILGNVGTVIVARVSGDDAELLAKHLVIENPETLIELNNHEAFVRSLDDKGPTRLDILAMAPPPAKRHNRADALLLNSRVRWGRARAQVEAAIMRDLGADKPAAKLPTPSRLAWSLPTSL